MVDLTDDSKMIYVVGLRGWSMVYAVGLKIFLEFER